MGNFNMLPKEIMLEIFSRLPAEHVLECKSVSRPWRNLLRHPSFPQMHLNHLNEIDSAGNLSLIFYSKWSEPFYYTEYDENFNCFNRRTRINLRPLFESSYILCSCNGLICFSAMHESYYPQPVYICNPITREYIVIPTIEGKALLTGFGYSPSTNKYKVVRIFRNKRDPNYGIIQVYTLGSGIGWRNGRKMDYDVMSFFPRGVFKNNIWSKEFSNINGKPISFTKSGGLLCYDRCGENVYLYASKASSSRMLVNSGKNFYVGVPHKNSLVSLKALGEEGTKLLDSGERARPSGEQESSDHYPTEKKEEKYL